MCNNIYWNQVLQNLQKFVNIWHIYLFFVFSKNFTSIITSKCSNDQNALLKLYLFSFPFFRFFAYFAFLAFPFLFFLFFSFLPFSFLSFLLFSFLSFPFMTRRLSPILTKKNIFFCQTILGIETSTPSRGL